MHHSTDFIFNDVMLCSQISTMRPDELQDATPTCVFFAFVVTAVGGVYDFLAELSEYWAAKLKLQ